MSKLDTTVVQSFFLNRAQSIKFTMAVINLTFGILLFAVSILFIAFLILTRKTTFECKHKYIHEAAEYPANNNNNFSTDPSKPIKLQFAKSGIASFEQTPPLTVMDLLSKCCSNKPNARFLAKEYRDDATNYYKWKYWTRQECLSLIQSAARGFIALGLKQFEAVCIMGFNCPEWFLSDMAAIYAGGSAVGLYSTNNAGQCQYIINHCSAKIIVCEDGVQLDKFLEIQNDGKLGNVQAIIVWNDDDAVKQCPKNDSLKIITWNDLISKYGNSDVEKHNKIISQRQQIITPGMNIFTLIHLFSLSFIIFSTLLHTNLHFWNHWQSKRMHVVT